MIQYAVWSEDARLRAALDAMPHKVWIVMLDGPPIYYNPAMRDFAGSALRLPDRSSRERALIHPEDLPRFVPARNAAVAAEKDWTVEVRLRCPDGGFRWHRLNFSLLRSGAKAFAYLATATDIDDLQRALTIAQESEEQLRLAAEAAQLGIYAFDLQSEHHTWSDELKRIFGLSPSQPPPARIIDLIHPDDRERFDKARKTSLDPNGPGTFEDEHRILRADGSEGWVFAKGRVSFAGEGAERRPSRGMGLVLDVTNRKQAERALIISEERYRMLFEQANDIVVTLQLDGRIVSINPAAHDILGFAPDELIGKTIYEFVPRELMPMQVDLLRRKLEGAASTQYDLDVITKDKRRRVLGVNSRLVVNEVGAPVLIYSIARDITERKEAERRQELLVRELQHRTKNMLAIIQSIASKTLKGSSNLETFIGRLHALAHAQEFVAAGPQGGVPLYHLIETALAAFGARAKIDGTDLVVNGSFAQNIALLVHELATNAVKYGAFSSTAGWVEIRWETTTTGENSHLLFYWREHGGPSVHVSTHKGFGTSLMSLFRKSSLEFAPTGLTYKFSVPLREVVSTDEPA